MILSASFDHLVENVSYKEVQSKLFSTLVKTSYSPAENINEAPDALLNSLRQAGDQYVQKVKLFHKLIFLLSFHFHNFEHPVITLLNK